MTRRKRQGRRRVAAPSRSSAVRSRMERAGEKSPSRCYYDYPGLISLSDNRAIMVHARRRWLARLSDRCSWRMGTFAYLLDSPRDRTSRCPCVSRRISSKIILSRDRLKNQSATRAHRMTEYHLIANIRVVLLDHRDWRFSTSESSFSSQFLFGTLWLKCRIHPAILVACIISRRFAY